MKEIWKDIPGFEGRYQVSNLGIVKSLIRPYQIKSIVLKPMVNKSGYLYIHLYKDCKQHHKFIHRLVLRTFTGSCPVGMETRHLNGIKADNRLENLRWDTKSENGKDRVKHGSIYKGGKNGRAKLTEDNVKYIRSSNEQGVLLASRFRVSPQTICSIKQGRNWSHIEELT